MLFRVVNERGLEEIRDFLGRRHKLGRDHFDDEMIRAWASDAEFQLGEGNPPIIEIRSFDGEDNTDFLNELATLLRNPSLDEENENDDIKE